VANLGFDSISFPAPVVHGDTLKVSTTVTSLRDSKSRPGVGIASFEHTGTNQRDEVVVLCRRNAMINRRPAGG
jgi:acyl dehydratase